MPSSPLPGSRLIEPGGSSITSTTGQASPNVQSVNWLAALLLALSTASRSEHCPLELRSSARVSTAIVAAPAPIAGAAAATSTAASASIRARRAGRGQARVERDDTGAAWAKLIVDTPIGCGARSRGPSA